MYELLAKIGLIKSLVTTIGGFTMQLCTDHTRFANPSSVLAAKQPYSILKKLALYQTIPDILTAFDKDNLGILTRIGSVGLMEACPHPTDKILSDEEALGNALMVIWKPECILWTQSMTSTWDAIQYNLESEHRPTAHTPQTTNGQNGSLPTTSHGCCNSSSEQQVSWRRRKALTSDPKRQQLAITINLVARCLVILQCHLSQFHLSPRRRASYTRLPWPEQAVGRMPSF